MRERLREREREKQICEGQMLKHNVGFCVVDLETRFNLKMCEWELKKNEIIIKSK